MSYQARLTISVSALLLMSPVQAQNAAIGGSNPTMGPQACELHVWPAHSFGARSQGLGAITGALGTLDDDNRNHDRNTRDEKRLATYLSPETQKSILESVNLQQFFPQTIKVKYHDAIEHRQEGVPSGTFSKIKSAPSETTCSYELFVIYIRFDQSPLYPATISFGVNVKAFDASSIKRKKDIFYTGKFKASAFKVGEGTSGTSSVIRDEAVSGFKRELQVALTRSLAKLKKT